MTKPKGGTPDQSGPVEIPDVISILPLRNSVHGADGSSRGRLAPKIRARGTCTPLARRRVSLR